MMSSLDASRATDGAAEPGAPNEFEEDEITVRLRERFEEFDEDGSGDHDKEEMMLFAQDSGVRFDVSEEDIGMMLDMSDANGDGKMARAAAAHARLPPHPRAAAAAAAPARF